MPTNDTRRPRFWQASAGLLLLVIFALDAVVRADVAVTMLYVVPTILFVVGATFAEPLIVAAVATVLMAAGFFLSPGEVPANVALANRLLSVVVAWGAAGLVVGYVRQVERWGRRMTTANEAAEQSLRRLRDVEHALDQSAIVAATDQTGTITYVNDKFCAISKYSRGELIGQDHWIIRRTIPRSTSGNCGGRSPRAASGAVSCAIVRRTAPFIGWTRRSFSS